MRVLASASLRFDVFTLDPVRGVLLRDGAEVPLRRQSFEVLRYLAENAGRTVVNDELVHAVWVAKPADQSASVAQCIKDIRRALGEDARWIVRTVSGRGYEFMAEIVRREPTPPAQRSGSGQVATSLHARVFRRRAAAAGGVACACLAAVYLPGQFASPRPDRTAALVASAEAARAPSGSALSASFGGSPIAKLFGQREAQRVTELAASKELPLPPFQMRAPGQEIPADVRRFVGIWASAAGWIGSNRQYMLIITDADRNGMVAGYHVNGPPQPGSRYQSLAHFSAFTGSVSAASLSTEDSSGKFAASFLGEDRIQLDLTFRDGFVARVVLDPVWMLVTAERTDAMPRTAGQVP